MSKNFLKKEKEPVQTVNEFSQTAEEIDEFSANLIPIQIEYLRNLDYPGSELKIESRLPDGSNYRAYVASYYSQGLKQFGLLTVPVGEIPERGFPAIIFNHGYIDPEVYKTTQRYESYQDYFATRGYVVFKPDYRGHGNSEGEALGGYGNSDYIIDVLNAFATIQKLDYVNPEALGMWGHSMGGWIVHRAMVVNPEIEAGVIWAGMVGGYEDLLQVRLPWWERRGLSKPTPDPDNPRRLWREYLVKEYGTWQENKKFWDSISAVTYLDQLSGPIQLHHATGDKSVPAELSRRFFESLGKVSQESEIYLYQGDDHNISANFGTAMQRSVEFFDRYLQ